MSEAHPIGNSAELAALYVTGAMTEAERGHFESHLAAGCSQCDAEIMQLCAPAAALAATIEPIEPEPATREKLLRRIASDDRTSSEQGPEHRTDHLHAERGATAPWRPMQPDPASQLYLLRSDEGTWEQIPVEGVSVRMLYVDRQRRQFTALVRMAPGAIYPEHTHQGAEECLVLEGDLRIGDLVLRERDFQRTPPGFRQGVQSTDNGCLLLVTTPFD